MSYQITEREFRDVLEIVGKVGETVEDDVVAYQASSTYDPKNEEAIRYWEEFLSNVLRHILARLAYKKHLDRKYDIGSKVPGIDTDIDWLSFHSPWNQRLGISINSQDINMYIKGVKSYHKYVPLTETQYNRAAENNMIVGAGSVSFGGLGSGEFDHPRGDGLRIVEASRERDPDKTVRGPLENRDEIKNEWEQTDDYGIFTVYKFNQEIDWIVDHNTPVEVSIRGLVDTDEFIENTEDVVTDYEADYISPISRLKNTREYLH